MTTAPTTATAGPDLTGSDLTGPVLDGLESDAAIAEAVAAMRAVDDAVRAAIVALQQVDGRRVAAEEGLAVDTALRLHTGVAGQDVAMLTTAAEVLRRLPTAAALFAGRVLSWGHVRQLVFGVRRFDAATCAALDGHLATHAARLARVDSDQVAGMLDDAVVHHERLATVEARHDREVEANRFVLQPRFDGTATSWGQWDREATALLADALQAEADAPKTTPCPTPSDDGDGDHDGDGGDVPRSPTPSRSQQLADALLRLITRGRTGADAPTPPARFTVVVDTATVTDRAAGVLQTALRTRPPRIVARALDRLACDTALDVVVRDGTGLLAAQRYTPEVTAATRRAVTARDGGCRFPACTAPVAWTDIHHVIPRAHTATTGGPPTGDHHPTNLVLLCRRHHTQVHRRSWRQTLRPDGTYTLRRRGRTWTTLPRTATDLPPPDPPPPHDGSPEGAGPPGRAGPDRPPDGPDGAFDDPLPF